MSIVFEAIACSHVLWCNFCCLDSSVMEAQRQKRPKGETWPTMEIAGVSSTTTTEMFDCATARDASDLAIFHITLSLFGKYSLHCLLLSLSVLFRLPISELSLCSSTSSLILILIVQRLFSWSNSGCASAGISYTTVLVSDPTDWAPASKCRIFGLWPCHALFVVSPDISQVPRYVS